MNRSNNYKLIKKIIKNEETILNQINDDLV
jgi:hypothetical protein